MTAYIVVSDLLIRFFTDSKVSHSRTNVDTICICSSVNACNTQCMYIQMTAYIVVSDLLIRFFTDSKVSHSRTNVDTICICSSVNACSHIAQSL